MKYETSFGLIAFCLMLSLNSFAKNGLHVQFPNLFIEEPTASVNNGWGKFLIGAVVEPLTISSSNINFVYIDESPSRDNLLAEIDLKSGTQSYGLVIGMEFSNPSGFTWSFDGTFSTDGDNNLSGANLGFGYRIRTGKLFLIPMVKGGIGNGNFKLGEIKNNDAFIQVNDTEFFSEEVVVKLRDQYAYVAPELNLFIPIKDKWGIQLSGSYKYAFNRGERLSFRGYLDINNDDSAKEFEDISASNVFLSVDGQRVVEQANLMEFGGFKAQFSLVFFAGR